jgi:nucleotide-binding universal stress UspA family protein
MFKNVLVGIDADTRGVDAIALAGKLFARDGQLTFAHVYHDGAWRHPLLPEDVVKSEHALELLQPIAERAGLEASMRWRESSSVGRGLHELCELTEADLLVVGSSRHGLIGRALLSDHTRDALNGVPCAIAIAPTGYAGREEPLHEIGVGYDGSPESERALEIARTLAREGGARLSAFEVVPVPTYVFLGGPMPTSHQVEDAVSEARERIAQLDGGFEAHAAYGDPTEELALYSASLGLLVVGSRGYGPIRRLMHGSTSQQLAHVARCPLLVLPRPGDER